LCTVALDKVKIFFCLERLLIAASVDMNVREDAEDSKDLTAHICTSCFSGVVYACGTVQNWDSDFPLTGGSPETLMSSSLRK